MFTTKLPKYNAVITYIFGHNQEILKEPQKIDGYTDYICITNQTNLKSKHWKIIYDEIPQTNISRDKVVYVKFNPFKYTTAKNICIIDGTIEIKAPLYDLFQPLSEYDILVKKHTERNCIADELIAWKKLRNLKTSFIEKFKILADTLNVNLSNEFLIEGNIIVIKNNDTTKYLFENLINNMEKLSEDILFPSNQCMLSLMLQAYNINYDYIKNPEEYFSRYEHNSNIKRTIT